MAQEEPGVRNPGAKLKHIEACMRDDVEHKRSAGFERFDFVHQALPNLCLDEIDLSLSLLGAEVKAPLMIAPMTGGVGRGHDINRMLAAAAQRHGLAMGLGSVRLAIEDPSRADLFRVRDIAPDVLLFANVGAGQLRSGWGPDECLRAVELVEANHLLIHLNPIQEAVQGGDVDFRGTLGLIADVADTLTRRGISVGVREVGFGLSARVAQQLIDVGIHLLDCGGVGGTSWAKVEALCAEDPAAQRLGNAFAEWGIRTTDSLRAIHALGEPIYLIATGGLRSGIDVAKAIALGADLGAMARPFLLAASRGEDELESFILQTLAELRVAMFGIGAADVIALKGTPHLVENGCCC